MVIKQFKFENGDYVQDIITGLQGTITGTCYYITGCNQYLIVPECADGRTKSEGVWFDEQRLDLRSKNTDLKQQIINDNNGPDTCPPIGSKGF